MKTCVLYVYDNSLISSKNEKRCRQKLYRNQNTHFIFNNFFRKSCRLCVE